MSTDRPTSRRARLRRIRDDLGERWQLGEFEGQPYTSPRSHEYDLNLHLGVLLGLADQFERWTDAEKADHAEALEFVASELEAIAAWLERVSETVGTARNPESHHELA